MRLLVVLLGLVLLMPAHAASAVATATEEEKLNAFFQKFLDEEHAAWPLAATQLGDRRFDDKLDDPSAANLEAGKARYRRFQAELPKQVDYQKLSRDGQIDYEIFAHHLERSLWLAENLKPYETDPRSYVSLLTDSTYLLLTQSSAAKPVNIRNCVARMRQMPRVIAVAKTSLKDCPRVFVETAIRQTKGAISYYQSGIYQLAGETPQFSEISKAAPPVLAALQDYLQHLEKEVLPKATENWRLGKEKFAQKLRYELEAGLGAEEILQDAEREANRVESEMYVIARQLWSSLYPGEALPPDDADGRSRTIRFVLNKLAKKHGTVAGLVQDVRNTVAEVKKFIADKDILQLPEPDTCQIVEMPEFQRGNTTAYLNPAPPLDPKAGSCYAVSPPPADWDERRQTSYLEEYNDYMTKILTIHEGYPGHYVQLDYANRCPSLIRKVLYSGVFAEGWAVYTEQMMLDQGFGNGDLALRLHQLKFYQRAVINTILDHKMHCTALTDQEALDLLIKRAYQAEGEALGKIIRSKQTACQLSTYFVGRMAFYRLRQQIQREWGDRFILGRYHEAVLAHGTVPVKYLPELVRRRVK
jgi:uncharacterized protein (DUF885 family)